jgi:ATP-binding cassette subfamily F protein 3
VHTWPGNYEDYIWRKQGGPEALTQSGKAVDSEPAKAVPASSSQATTRSAPVQPSTPQPAAKAVDRRLNPIKLRQMKERRRSIEDEVTRLEVEIADFEAALRNFRSAEETQQIMELLAARRADLESLLNEWEEVAQTIEANS